MPSCFADQAAALGSSGLHTNPWMLPKFIELACGVRGWGQLMLAMHKMYLLGVW